MSDDKARQFPDPNLGFRAQFRGYAELVRRQRALARLGVRVSGFESLWRYRTSERAAAVDMARAANDNPGPRFSLRFDPSIAISVVAIVAVGIIVYFSL
ncbi:hypothetical protein [Pararhizobium mangrovi]|uniref:Uncharacterized protein n=1 Tax=Pararhizobium mangrovi TaxID=2590452 RepID=A0A506UB99_9HYPH|nr:hypothetical protein [Pararhizobium mangrovi]TPW30401.1 hypothetical protein FJU11_05170 [Pararhizobium mangrovi]